MAALSRLRWRLELPLARTSVVVATTCGFNHIHHDITHTPSSQIRLLKPKPAAARRPAVGVTVPTTNFRSPSRHCSLLAGLDILRCCMARTSDHDRYAWVRPNALPSQLRTPNCWCGSSDRTGSAERGYGGEVVEGGWVHNGMQESTV